MSTTENVSTGPFDVGLEKVMSKTRFTDCPSLADIEGTIQETTSTTITCIYPQSLWTDEAAIEEYVTLFGEDEDYDRLLTQACFTHTTECGIDPETEEKIPLCSTYTSTTNLGQRCRRQGQKPGNEDQYDILIDDYCVVNTTADCRCVDRISNLAYQQIVQDPNYIGGTEENDVCWWKSCGNSDLFLVPPTMVKESSSVDCQPVLQSVSTVIDNNVSQMECCDLKQNVIYAPDGTTSLPITCFFQDAQKRQETMFSTYGWILIVVAIVFALLIIVLLGIGIYSNTFATK